MNLEIGIIKFGNISYQGWRLGLALKSESRNRLMVSP